MINKNEFDYVIIGAGIVGMSVAYELTRRHPKIKVAILEKEPDIGKHASGRNSGVLHCGIFYREDSLKAKVCARGSAKMLAFAKEHQIPHFNGGKVIVPTSETLYPTMQNLMKNAKDNGIPAELIDSKQLLELEPFSHPAEKAIYCPTTSMIDNKAVLQKLKSLLIKEGVQFFHDSKVIEIHTAMKKLKTTQAEFHYGYLFNCAGAYADQLARMEGLSQSYTLLPFKGIYYKLTPESAKKINSNIYPVPNIATPFLGVHFTRSLSGDVYVGPTAIPVLGRENYTRLNGVNYQEASELFYQMGKLFWSNENDFRKVAQSELMKYSKRVFFEGAKKLLPSLKMEDLISSDKAGIRPQLMNKKTKALEMDYIFEKTTSSIHVLNAISPAFTSSFAFAEMILNEACMD
jgi:L-2-hydroxyglutarate oxidase